jgi:V/A-type H+-transporting ATPase subunit I
MAIENVVMMDVVGKIKDVDAFARDIFLFNEIQIVDAMQEIDSGRFILPIREENITELLGFSRLVSGETLVDAKDFINKISRLNDLYRHSLQLDMNACKKAGNSQSADIEKDLKKAMEKFKEIETDLMREYDEITELEQRVDALMQSRRAYSYINELDIHMSDLNHLENFSYSIGSVTRDNAVRLKSIYNSVTSIVFHVGNLEENEEVFMIISPKDLEIESQRILKALNYKPIEGFNEEYTDSPGEILKLIDREIMALREKNSDLQQKLEMQLEQNRKDATASFNVFCLFGNLNIIKRYMAFSDENFYFSGWISKKDRQEMERLAARYPEMIMVFSEGHSGRKKPPTKMKNNWLFQPFETLVKMYGVPSFNELDPTPFLSLTYMFCFGFMFGDVGQGIILSIVGLILGKKGVVLGKVLFRLGLCSIFFGFMYGSLFGFEGVIPAVWLRPYDQINAILITAVVIGVLMLLTAYAYSIVNKLKKKEIREGIFGKNGICGLLLYIAILGILGFSVGLLPAVPIIEAILIGVAVVMIAVVLIREPLTNFVLKRKPLYPNTVSGYYVESSFEIFEMLLGMLSNTLSFIRIGAFALTHVGLFMAFQTLALMAQNHVIGVGIFILANIFIIVMEGLIVSIQALRLQFYELFSKYYSGEGTEFNPVDQEIKLF